METTKFYLYRHIRKDKNEVFYVGIGTKTLQDIKYFTFNRAFSSAGRNKYWNNIVRNTEYEIEIIFESDSVEKIKKKEKEFISLYGRKNIGTGTLCNMTDGGDGINGLFHSVDTRQKISSLKRGIQLSEKHRNNIRLSMIQATCNYKPKNSKRVFKQLPDGSSFTFSSVGEAARMNKISRQSVLKAINSKKRKDGTSWKFLD